MYYLGLSNYGYSDSNYGENRGLGPYLLVIAAKTHRTVLSSEPDTIFLWSELMATLLAQLVCPLRVDLHAPDSRSQTLH